MTNFIIYSIEIAISLALFYIAYWVFLKNETFFKLNRFYLVFSVVISLLTPMLNIDLGQDSFLQSLVLPVDQYEQNIIGNDQLNNEAPISENGDATLSKDAALHEDVNNIYHGREHAGLSYLFKGNEQEQNINWLTILLVIYFIGVVFFLIRFIANFIWIFSYVFKNKSQLVFGMKVIKIEKNLSPFSFLNFIFINNKEYPEAELAKIISHEKIHIQQKHSIDLILVELLLAFQWFNPFVWFHKRAIKITHEYLADLGTLNSGIDMTGYQYSLLHQALCENNIEMTSTYNLSIKKRIEMMMKKRSAKLSTLKVVIALPILIFLLSAFAFNITSSTIGVNPRSFFTEDSSIKKVDVPAEYLKLLQGEYISTNDIIERKIVFTELLGTLFANDAGYTYRIIPVGGENFTNPDDKAPFAFNSKNKNAISLLLFGKINLNKVKVGKGSGAIQTRSMAFTLANVMLKEGIPAAISYHKIAKDSSNYFITENEMSYAGYYLLKSDKVKEAIALLKLDTELFPNSFNAYDSYAEVLLDAGDKTTAIENFKKSVQLNPGSQNGLKRLKELGINPDDVVKPVKISVEELKLLEGLYLSTDQPNWIRKINITVENGILMGEDNNYHYKLIHMGNGKFINPDDGQSLVFDTKDKSAINLLLFGTINLKKIKPSKEPTLNLKEYVGRYVPEKKDTVVGAIKVIIEDNKLFMIAEKKPNGPGGKLELEFVTDNFFYYPDNTGRSVDFIVNGKKQVSGLTLRRYESAYTLTKEK